MTINAAILCRVSSEGQRDNTSLPEQRRVLVEICERQGWRYEVFEEVQSGGDRLEDRPVLAQVLGRIAAGEFQRLVVLVQDRATRAELGDIERIKDILRKVGARLVTTSGEYDPRNTDHDLLMDFQAVLAKNERLRIRDRTIRGKEATVREGGFAGHPIPYGWRRVYAPDGTATIEIEPQQAAAVRRMFDLYARDMMGYVAIADLLRAEGYTWHDGEPLDWQHVYRVLRNNRYAGIEERRRDYTKSSQTTYLPGFQTESKVFEAIVPMDLFQRCQAIRKKRRVADDRREARHWPLSGILRCASCGGPMMIARAHYTDRRGQQAVYNYYRCYQKIKRLGDCKEPQNVRVEIAHRAVWRKLPDIMRWADSVEPVETDPNVMGEMRAVTIGLQELERRELDLFNLRQQGMDDGQWKRLNAALLEERNEMETRMKTVERQMHRPRMPGATIQEILQDETLLNDREDLHMLFSSVFRSVVLQRNGHKVRVGDFTSGPPQHDMRLQRAELIDGRRFP